MAYDHAVLHLVSMRKGPQRAEKKVLEPNKSDLKSMHRRGPGK
jgi:hypothetical protein